MNAADQLSMFEPEGAEALVLLRRHMGEATKQRKTMQVMELLELPGAARVAERLAQEAEGRALVLAILLDLEREAKL
jgi:hypothetical protein